MKTYLKLILLILAFAALFFGIHFGLDLILGRSFQFEAYLLATSILCGFFEFLREEQKAKTK